ncbi:TetR/AcrR family transcriptional regulator [Sinomonas atrocyanea]|jgi:DNA-binding transcriptional regulator YbjK|uniref:TetR/AcrR family transcriptional regulator n=1 Tax=Sinomonas atrocyanea TaxID=37927 RepID=UPI00277F6097|nr:TetR family transcriptional regulator [Sinomonas atrocyanea]MDQ0261417.1 DNA-binding transcriptional regulator YbjK [Sinomonas atrocyanea]MDR6623528.1 DNA-binding transcriptional regulator YbjK [Sinomonas atrocyanea]
MGTAAQGAAPRRRSDPQRRTRIIEACLEVIARDGVAGTSHRRVAAAADVPLGSMTYHFAGMEELLMEAFTRFADRAADEFDRRMGQAATFQRAQQAIADLINQDLTADPHALVITHELYTLAAREPAFRTITQHWMARSRQALGRHFDPLTSRILDALIEGLALHRAFNPDTGDETALEAVQRLTGPPTARPDSGR